MSADTIFISGRDSFGKLKPPSVVAIPKKRERRDHVNFSPPRLRRRRLWQGMKGDARKEKSLSSFATQLSTGNFSGANVTA